MAVPDYPWSGLTPPQRRITVDEVRRRALSLPEPAIRRLRHDIPPELVRTAATLVPIVDLDGEAAVVVTKRPSTMRYHRDDWVMPGGRVDPTVDADGADAARREAHEELGVAPGLVDIVGRLSSHGPIVTGFVIEVYLGLIVPGTPLQPDPREVAEAIAIPLSELASPGRYYEDTHTPDHDTGPVATRDSSARPNDGAEDQAKLRFFVIRPGELLWGTQGEILFELFSHLYADR